jgi:hypothetical protein
VFTLDPVHTRVHAPNSTDRSCLLDGSRALLQCLIEDDELFRPGIKGTHPCEGDLLGSLNLDVPGLAFCAHPLKGLLKIRESILRCGDGSFPAF